MVSSNAPHRRVALVIPHMDRHIFLDRMLAYYQWAQFEGGIYIIDASEDGDAVKHVTVDGVNVRHLHVPELRDPFQNRSQFFMQLALGGELAAQDGYDFIVHAGNDDFILPVGLDVCVRYLDDFPDEPLAVGQRYQFALDREGPFGNLMRFNLVKYPPMTSWSIGERLGSWFQMPFTLQFGVMRTPVYCEIHNRMNAANMPTFYVGNELFANMSLLMEGKIEQATQVPTVLFQQHNDKPFFWGTNAKISVGLMCDENFGLSWGNMVGILSQKWLSKEDDKDELFVREALGALLSQHLSSLLMVADIQPLKPLVFMPQDDPYTLPEDAPNRQHIQPIFDLMQGCGEFVK